MKDIHEITSLGWPFWTSHGVQIATDKDRSDLIVLYKIQQICPFSEE